MNTQFWLLITLLHALTALEFSDDTDCASISSTVTLNLNASHVVRTWQPSTAADCPWTEVSPPRWSQVTVRSQPRWLVMQLRRPMLVERVRVQGWDGEWQTAGTVGSRVSAFGAASLPLELQLEDPCRASWEVFGGFWSSMKESRFTALTYILINEVRSDQWSTVTITGKLPPLRLKAIGNSFCTNSDFMIMRVGDSLCFVVDTCKDEPVTCAIATTSGSLQQISRLNRRPIKSSSGFFTSSFELKAATWHHGASLICQVTNQPKTRVVQTLATIIEPEVAHARISPVWVSGRNVTVNFTTIGSYPEPTHQCWVINSSQSTWNMTKVSLWRRIIFSTRNLTAVSVSTQFYARVSPSMLSGVLQCAFSTSDARNRLHVTYSNKHFNVTSITAPCVTEVDLGSSQQWLEGEVREIRVTSRNCSIWNVTHTCWLLAGAGGEFIELNKTQQNHFASTHQFIVTRRMSLSDWQVRCRVNQSGVVYDDVVTRIEPNRNAQTAGVSRLTVKIVHVAPIVLIIFALTIFATWKLAWMRAKARLTLDQQQRRCGAMEMQPVNQATAARQRSANCTDANSPYDLPTLSSADDNENGVYEQPDEQNTDHEQRPVTAPVFECTMSEYINLR